MDKDYKKLYEEALNRAKYLKENTDSVCAKDISCNFEYIFPELCEPEDEKIRKEIIDFVKKIGFTKEKSEKWIVWLKKQAEQKPSWSEEDKKMKSLIISTLTSMGTLNLERYHHMNLDEVKEWLESIKDRVHPQLKQEWNEEDEKIMKRIDSLLYSQCTIHGSEYEGIHNWLKSLNPQSHWKPSEEQMEALKNAIIGKRGPLYELYFDLKKL